MSATISDYFNKASNMSGSYPAVATVTAARSTGGSTLSCDDLSTWATDTPVHFSTFKVNADGTIDTATQTDWKGIVNGNTITDMTRLAGAADSGNASGDRVELNPTVGWLDDLITGILVSHKQNGALKDSVVTESTIATGAVTNTKLGDGSVTSAKVATGAISSYDKIGDDVIQARNIKGYQVGSTLKIGDTGPNTGNTDHFQAAGMLTSSKTEIVWSLPIPESLKNINTVTLTNAKVWVRIASGGDSTYGYIINGVDIVSQATSVTVGKVNDHLVTISAYKSGGWSTAAVNNIPLTVSGSCVFSLS